MPRPRAPRATKLLKRARYLREARALSYNQIADELGCSYKTIARLLTNNKGATQQ